MTTGSPRGIVPANAVADLGWRAHACAATGTKDKG
jgi:hypothetical protein